MEIISEYKEIKQKTFFPNFYQSVQTEMTHAVSITQHSRTHGRVRAVAARFVWQLSVPKARGLYLLL